uniref:Putative glycosyltransferase n=1 Tax=viral metagenome TaxID=1070528 RepID=A0A6M3XTU1_9ZZZZ
MEMEEVMIKLNLVDNHFPHAKCSSGNNIPKLMEWNRDITDSAPIFFTDRSIHLVPKYKGLNKKICIFLIESPDNTVVEHNFVLNNSSLFTHIFTSWQPILDKCKNSSYIPSTGGCWIEPTERMIYDKTFPVSFVCSNKNRLPGHKFRQEVADYMTIADLAISCFGDRFNRYVTKKIDTLKDFQYQIVVENGFQNWHFTEKLLDCFQTGTIPIYRGCDISKFFNMNGVIQFKTIHGLNDLLDDVTMKLSKRIKDAIKENFEISKQYLIPEDYMVKHYKDIIWT